jgi:hypothetical protein
MEMQKLPQMPMRRLQFLRKPLQHIFGKFNAFNGSFYLFGNVQ